MSGNTKMDGENGDGETMPLNAKMTPDLPLLVERKEYLPLPKWLNNDYKSNVADLEGWQCMEIARADGSGKKDKYYTHKDYAHTFRSKKEVQHFLDTGEVKGKGLLQKKLADDPSGQSSGARRSTKRTMLLPANNDPPKRLTEYKLKLKLGRAARWEETLEGYLQRQEPRRRSTSSTRYTATTHRQGRARVDSEDDNDSDGDGGAGTAAGTSGAAIDDDVDRENLRREDE